MSYAIVLSLCVVAASPASPTAAVEVESAARAFRIESYNRHREDRDRYRELRQADDELRLALSATKEEDLARRQEEAVVWYREATSALHTDGDLPSSPVWLAEALADAGKIRDQKLTPPARSTPAIVQSLPARSPSQALPPAVPSAKQVDEGKSPFFFVDAALRAAGNLGAGAPSGQAEPAPEIQEPAIFPPGPIVDELPELPAAALPTLLPAAEERDSAGAVGEPADEAAIEPEMDLPSLEEPEVELPSLPSLEEDPATN